MAQLCFCLIQPTRSCCLVCHQTQWYIHIWQDLLDTSHKEDHVAHASGANLPFAPSLFTEPDQKSLTPQQPSMVCDQPKNVTLDLPGMRRSLLAVGPRLSSADTENFAQKKRLPISIIDLFYLYLTRPSHFVQLICRWPLGLRRGAKNLLTNQNSLFRRKAIGFGCRCHPTRSCTFLPFVTARGEQNSIEVSFCSDASTILLQRTNPIAHRIPKTAKETTGDEERVAS